MAANHFSSGFSLTLVANLIMQGIIRQSLMAGHTENVHQRAGNILDILVIHLYRKRTYVVCKVTYRVFEPGYPDDPDHDSANDCP